MKNKSILLVHNRSLPIYNKNSRGAIEKLERIYLEYNESKNYKFTIYSPKIAKDNFDAKKVKNATFRNIDLSSLKSKVFRAFYALKRRIFKKNNEYYIRQVIKDIKKRGEENAYDLIIFENEEGSIPLFRKKTGTKTRIALHLHNDYVNVDRKDSKEILDNCDEVWCVSEFIESRIKAVKEIKTVVIPNTVEPLPAASPKEVAKLKEKYNPDKNTIFLFVGRLLEVKGIRELVDAFNIYNKEKKNAKLIIIGDFEKSLKDMKFAKRMRAKFASNPNIDAVGYKNTAEIANYYKITDAQIIPSKWNEAFGLVVLEAMQGGVKIVCSSHGAFREICGDDAIYVSRENMEKDLIDSMRKHAKPYRLPANYYEGKLEKYKCDVFCKRIDNAIDDIKRKNINAQNEREKLVSIIIPAYNSEQTIKKSLDSILKQTYQNFEVIVVNDGSTDDTELIVKSIGDERIKCYSIDNSGVSHARNYGIDKAKGDFVAFLDSDDYYSLTFLEEMVAEVKKSKCDLARCVVRYDDGVKNHVEEIETLDFSLNANEAEKIFFYGEKTIKCLVSALLIKKQLLIDYDIRFNEEITMMEDVLFYRDLINRASGIQLLNRPLFNYYQNPSSVTHSSKKYQRIIKDIIEVNNKIRFESEEKNNKLSRKHFFIILHFALKLKSKDILNCVKDKRIRKLASKVQKCEGCSAKERIIARAVSSNNKVIVLLFWLAYKIKVAI